MTSDIGSTKKASQKKLVFGALYIYPCPGAAWNEKGWGKRFS